MVLEEASTELLQKFELFSNQVFENLRAAMGMERIQQLEQKMFIKKGNKDSFMFFRNYKGGKPISNRQHES